MTNSLLVPEQIAEVTAKLVGADLNLAALVHRDLEAEFGSGSGSTVKVRVPGAVPSRTRGIYDVSTPLASDEINEESISVTLSEHCYSNVALSEGDLDLDLGNFASRVLLPQATAVVKRVEREVAAAMTSTPETKLTYDPSNPATVFTAIRRQLRDNGVPAGVKLTAAVGSNVYADLMDGPTGSAGTTFDADGRVRGFDVVESTRLGADEIVAFVKEAFALVVRAPQVPAGAPYGASVSEGGFALRHLRAYDTSTAVDRSLVSSFVGVSAMPLAIDNENGTVTLKPHAGAVRVITTPTD